jgi:uncharacterized membrane protein YphA (DoxX/SURF4 family)
MTTKTANILYWTTTGLFAAMMLFSGITNLLGIPDAVAMIVDHLHYPPYFMYFLGLAKVVGAVGLLVPGFPRTKEWAYAGFFFDLVAAMWSLVSVSDPVSHWLPIVLFIAVLFVSYGLHHRKMKKS